MLWLEHSAPVSADRYTLYRDMDEISKTMTMVGYGRSDNGENGAINVSSGGRTMAVNTVDTFTSALTSFISWKPLSDTQFVVDFDSGRTENDTLGRLLHLNNLGLGASEGMIAPGDSGSPAFIEGKVAGIASLTASPSAKYFAPDVDNVTNSSFGEIASWQRISSYQDFTDTLIRAHFPDAPTKASEVQKSVQEGDDGTNFAYFFLEFHGDRNNTASVLHVDYATRDGSAQAYLDYIPVLGTLNLYQGQSSAVIAVEIIGDTLHENDETFYLDITNPFGASFKNGAVQLTAMRTIIDDDPVA